MSTGALFIVSIALVALAMIIYMTFGDETAGQIVSVLVGIAGIAMFVSIGAHS